MAIFNSKLLEFQRVMIVVFVSRSHTVTWPSIFSHDPLLGVLQNTLVIQNPASENKTGRLFGETNAGWWFGTCVFFIFPIWLSYFSEGLKPPSRTRPCAFGMIIANKRTETLKTKKHSDKTWENQLRWKANEDDIHGWFFWVTFCRPSGRMFKNRWFTLW